MISIKHNNKGMTLMETIIACVLMTILMAMLTKGIMAASNWFAESEMIKRNGEIVSNRIEGKDDDFVNMSQSDLNVSLHDNISNAYDLQGVDGYSKTNTYSYDDGDSTTSFKTITTNVPDYVEQIGDPVYQPTLDDIAGMKDSLAVLLNKISEDGYTSVGFVQEWHTTNNDKFTEVFLKQYGQWPVLSDEFIKKYNVLQPNDGVNGGNKKLVIRAYFYDATNGNGPDVLYYVALENQNWRPFMIYVPDEGKWYIAPKGKDNNRYVNITIGNNHKLYSGTVIEDAIDNDDDIHVELSNKDYITVTGSQSVLKYVTTPSNGWRVLLPD